MNNMQVFITVITVALLSSCSPAAQPGISKVGIHVTLEDGLAYCEFMPDGQVEGGHTSGGLEPYVHIDQATLPEEQVEAIWAAAGAIDPQLYPLATSASRGCVNCVDLFIHYPDGTILHLSWPVGEQHPDPNVQELETLLYEYHIGGW
ncbi:MAG: hypothetical protein FJZ96_01060 [Chloroflexi bacterium]|nr:hypothetical protein [Chloroflexota bacterium]